MEDVYSIQIKYAVLILGNYGYYPVALFSDYGRAKSYLDLIKGNTRKEYYQGKFRLVNVADYKTPLLGGVLNFVTE